MEELLIVLLQFFFETLINILVYWPFEAIDWPESTKSSAIWPACMILFVSGNALAGLSLIFFGHSLIAWPALRMANLLISPLLSGWLFRTKARYHAQKDMTIEPPDHFWPAFWFTLGFVALRFAYVNRA